MSRSAATLAAVLGLACATACTGGLDSPTIVITPRVLAITADRPEARPGEDITLRAFAYDPEGRALRYRWRVEIDPGRLLGASTGARADIVCPSLMCVPLAGEAREAVIPGAVTQGILDNIDLVGTVGGFDASILRAILATAGLSFEVHVDVVTDDGVGGEAILVSAYRRVAMTTRAEPTTNPPPIDYLVAGVEVRSANDPLGDPFDCLVARPIRLAAGERVILAPQGDESEWIETYPVFDYTGGIREGRENAYYSWYATAGSLSAETTRPPDRDVFYRAPAEPGLERIFLVVRDGHLGTRACSLPIEITAAADAGP